MRILFTSPCIRHFFICLCTTMQWLGMTALLVGRKLASQEKVAALSGIEMSLPRSKVLLQIKGKGYMAVPAVGIKG